MRSTSDARCHSRHNARTAALLARVGKAAILAGSIAGCATVSGADQVVWVARGTTDLFFHASSGGVQAFSGLFTPATGGPGLALPNLMFPTFPGGTSGTFPLAISGQSYRMTDLAIGNDLHSSRTVVLAQPSSLVETMNLDSLVSLRLTTQGDLTILGNNSSYGVKPFRNSLAGGQSKWIVRDPQCTGTHTIALDTQTFGWKNFWVAGDGQLRLESLLHSSEQNPEAMIKMGPGTLVYNPTPSTVSSAPQCTIPLIVRDGTLALWGPGATPMISQDISIGAAYGGQEYPPSSIPPASWSPFNIPPTPPIAAPRVLIQADNVLEFNLPVHMGFNSTLQFEAPEPMSFLGRALSEAPGNGTKIVCNQQVFEAVSFQSDALDAFLGRFEVRSGIARLYGTPNSNATFVLGAPTFPYEAILEFGESTPYYSFGNSISGFGRVSKYGSGTLGFSADTTNFTGDFLFQGGETLIPSTAPASTLRNNVTVSGPSSILNQNIDNAVHAAATVKLDDSGTWRLNGRANSISRLSLVNNANLQLGGGSVNVTGGSIQTTISPGFANTARIAGAGTLSSPVPIMFDTFRGSGAADLDISAAVTAPSLTFTGPGFVRLSGTGAGAPPFTVLQGAVRLQRTGANNSTGTATIGNAAGPATDAAVILDANDQLSDIATVTLTNRAEFNLNGFSDVIGGLGVTGPGPFSITTSSGANPGALSLAGNASFAGSGTSTLAGVLNLAGGTRAFNIQAGSTVTLSGTANSGTLAKSGSGALRLDGSSGSFVLSNSGSTTSAGLAAVGGLAGSGSIRIDSSLTANVGPSVSAAFSGSLTGAGGFTKSGPGFQEFNSPVANTYAGGTRVEGGTLFLNRAPGNTVIPGDITVASGGTLLFAGGANNQIADDATVTVEAGGSINMAGQSETVRSAVVSGTWNIDSVFGPQGSLFATQSLFVAGGELFGTVSGGPLTISGGTARLRGTLPSVSLLGFNSKLAAGGFGGSSLLTVNGSLGFGGVSPTLSFITDAANDPALIRANGAISFPFTASVSVLVDHRQSLPVGTSFKLLDFSASPSNVPLSRFVLVDQWPLSSRGVLTINNRVLSYVITQNPCLPDMNGSASVSVQDLFDYLAIYFANSYGADFNRSGSVTVQDLFDFLAAFFNGC